MPTAKCKKCGGMTNSTTSDYWFAPNNEPTMCYARFEDGKWVKGCTEPAGHEKDWVDSLIHPRPTKADTKEDK